jgi:hypothetical protein
MTASIDIQDGPEVSELQAETRQKYIFFPLAVG